MKPSQETPKPSAQDAIISAKGLARVRAGHSVHARLHPREVGDREVAQAVQVAGRELGREEVDHRGVHRVLRQRHVLGDIQRVEQTEMLEQIGRAHV